MDPPSLSFLFVERRSVFAADLRSRLKPAAIKHTSSTKRKKDITVDQSFLYVRAHIDGADRLVQRTEAPKRSIDQKHLDELSKEKIKKVFPVFILFLKENIDL